MSFPYPGSFLTVPPQYDTSLPTTPFNNISQGATQPDVNAVANHWSVNRAPIGTRLRKAPLLSPYFMTLSDNFRASSQLLNQGATLGSGATTMTVTDGSQLTVGDILEIELEQVRVTGIASNVVTITRGFAGTAAVSHVDGLPIYTIGRATTGAEVATSGMSRIPTPLTQYAQTIQHTYQVGGSNATTANYFGGEATPFDRDRMHAMRRVIDDRERALVYGIASPASGPNTVQTMMGLRGLIVTNKTLSPTSYAAYKPSDLVRDLVQRCFDAGGEPSHIFVSTDWLIGLATWGFPQIRLNVGENMYGTAIESLSVPFLGNIQFIPCPLLRSGTAICLSSDEAIVREKRVIHEKPRGSRGDAIEGDFIWEGAPELDNESHHAWVSGVTGWASI